MGSWDVSCSLTGTPIFPGDDCVFVLLKKKFNLAGHIEWDARFDVETVIKGTYDDYGRIKPYQGDGVPDEVTELDDNGRFFFFVCMKAWDWAVERYPVREQDFWQEMREMQQKSQELADEIATKTGKPPIKRNIIPEDPPWHNEMKSVFVAFMYAHRNPLAGYWATGQYYTETAEEVLAITALVEDRLLELLMDRPHLAGSKYENKQSITAKTAQAVIDRLKEKVRKKAPVKRVR